MKKLHSLLSVLFLISFGLSQNKVNLDNLVKYGDKMFKNDDDKPYTGIVFRLDKSTGNKLIEGRYKNGIRNGFWKWWNKDGVIDSSGIYENNGFFKVTRFEYFSNGNKKREENYINKKQNGRWTEWYENGNLFKEGFYKNDSMEGGWSFYDTKGNQYKGEYIYLENLINSFGDGSLIDGKFLTKDSDNIWSILIIKNGTPTGLSIHFYPNGQKKYETNYKDGEWNGFSTEWYEDGQKKQEGVFKDGRPDGLLTNWYENGQKKYEQNWKDGEQEGVYINWYENGKKKTQTIYKQGYPDGLQKNWLKNGYLISGNINTIDINDDFIQTEMVGIWTVIDEGKGSKIKTINCDDCDCEQSHTTDSNGNIIDGPYIKCK